MCQALWKLILKLWLERGMLIVYLVELGPIDKKLNSTSVKKEVVITILHWTTSTIPSSMSKDKTASFIYHRCRKMILKCRVLYYHRCLMVIKKKQRNLEIPCADGLPSPN